MPVQSGKPFDLMHLSILNEEALMFYMICFAPLGRTNGRAV